jgi:hypothetical protein
MTPIIVGCLVGVVVLFLVVIMGGGKSLTAFMLRREIDDAVAKARPSGHITDVEVEGPDDLRVVVEDRGERHRLHVVSWGKYTAAIAHNPTASLPRSGTYTFDGQRSVLANNTTPEQHAEVQERIEAAVNAVLPTRGFHRIKAGSPDILVAYHAATDGPLSAAQLRESHGYAEADWIMGAGPSQEATGGTSVPVYEKGSLILDVLEPAGRRLGWRAAVVADIVVDVPAEEKDRRVRDAVELALRFFPPEPGPLEQPPSA